MPNSEEQNTGRPWKIYWIGVLIFLCAGAFGFIALCVWDELKDPRKRKFYILGFVTVLCVDLLLCSIMLALYFTVFMNLQNAVSITTTPIWKRPQEFVESMLLLTYVPKYRL